jgi:hypothetical protein
MTISWGLIFALYFVYFNKNSFMTISNLLGNDNTTYENLARNPQYTSPLLLLKNYCLLINHKMVIVAYRKYKHISIMYYSNYTYLLC